VTLALSFFALLACVLLIGIFSGSETGLYSLSRMRVEAEARVGQRTSRIITGLLRNEAWLLATLLVANTLVNQIATLVAEHALEPLGVPEHWHEVFLTLVIAPPIFLFGELIPKDLFRRRPHTLVSWCAPLIAVVRAVLAPLTLPLHWLTHGLTRTLGLDQAELVRIQGREAVIELLHERDVALQPHVEKMARNVLELRSRRVERVMVPWRKVEVLAADASPDAAWRQIAASLFSRLPVVDQKGAVRGYVHQLEVLGAGPTQAPMGHLRPMVAIEPDTPLDRALARLRATGQRAALVGSPSRPAGLVTLKDLVEEISGELARW
jgi:CBS domain containing-hemolysin-like protein